VPANTAAQWPGVNNNVNYSEGLNIGYRWYQAKNIAPLFPFGYGLSYTSFAFSNLSVSGVDSHGSATVTATLTNTGTKAGADVAQLYIGDPAAAGEPPLQLKGFQKITLAAGASTQVSFPVTMRDLSTWDDNAKKWSAITGNYSIRVGDTSTNPQLSGTLNVTSTSTGNAVTFPKLGGMSSPVGTAASLTVNATDSASGQTLTYSAANLPAGLSINSSTGVISGTATTTSTRTVTVTAKDGTGATGSSTFIWTTTPAGYVPTPVGPIVSGMTSTLCLDVQAANNANGTPVQTYTCNGSTAQQWTLGSDGSVQALGKCLDVTAGGTANGTKVQVYDCNGSGAQVWQHRSDGSFLNPSSGRCLDVPGLNTTPGIQVTIYDCNGGANQKWTTS
jgi:beta-glucosidase